MSSSLNSNTYYSTSYPIKTLFRSNTNMLHVPGEFDHDMEYNMDDHDHEFTTEFSNFDYPTVDVNKSVANREFSSLINASTALLNTASSNPVSGPPSPPPDGPGSSEFAPPTRPSSTPFPQIVSRQLLQFEKSDAKMANTTTDHEEKVMVQDGESSSVETCGFSRLPVEIHEEILDYVFGSQPAAQPCLAGGFNSIAASWNISTRRFTRRDISDLALVSRVWRDLVQSRIYRHIKLRGSVNAIIGADSWFTQHLYLASYIRHLEVWFPVFQPAAVANTTNSATAIVRIPPNYSPASDGSPRRPYIAPDSNCTLEDIFLMINRHLPSIKVLSLEGGDRRKAPKVQNQSSSSPSAIQGLVIPSVHTLVTRGQWNLIRKTEDFAFIVDRFPNLVEWHSSYSRQKSKTYITMGMLILPFFRMKIKVLNLRMESEYRRERACPPLFFHKVLTFAHVCPELGAIAKSLEHLTLKTIDITVKNICRFYEATPDGPSTGTGIQDALFIQYFEGLVISAVKCLAEATSVNYLRIRYVDLDSAVPPLNPYFLIKDNECSGVWSNAIVAELRKSRPRMTFPGLDSSCPVVRTNEDGVLVLNPDFKRAKVKSFKISNYAYIQQALSPV
ncbi:hypothetical protein Cpir12675_000894 [Ceratocystis pirilliformis]|uniref:F-box domain-containing protein n=1 Tax=Ceratocystis pirilliformis TaxID=259994 RepID=A0ABR3ZI90_9PEZI